MEYFGLIYYLLMFQVLYYHLLSLLRNLIFKIAGSCGDFAGYRLMTLLYLYDT